MSQTMWLFTILFVVMTSMGVAALFFGSDYAQKKWNPDYKDK